MPRLLIVGATGRMGQRLVLEGLRQGYAVTAAARKPERLEIRHPALALHALDVRDATAMAALVPGHDAVISALGHRRSSESPEVLDLGAQHLIAAMERAGVSRVMAIASAGILQLDAERLRCERPGYPEAFKAGSAMHRRVWERMEASSLDWTLVCPPELVEGEQALRAQADSLPEGPLRVSMDALARWMIDALSTDAWHARRVGVVNAPDPDSRP